MAPSFVILTLMVLSCSPAVRPMETEIVGTPGEVREGDEVTLVCRSSGARPAAVLSWFNGTEAMEQQGEQETAVKGRAIVIKKSIAFY